MKSINYKYSDLYKKIRYLIIFIIIVGTFSKSDVLSQPLKVGQSVVTSFDPVNPAYNCVKVIDVRNRPAYVNGGNFWIPNIITGTNWDQARMGYVYGIAIDDEVPPNIFVARSSVYCSSPPELEGLIYKINGSTWAVSDYVTRSNVAGPPVKDVSTIPNTGPGLGNLCYDKWHKQLFTTNLEDGKIYRIKGAATGIVKSFFDPFVADPMTSGFEVRGERLWGIGVYGKSSTDVRVYFGRWKSDRLFTGNGANEIWSVALDNNGDFVESTLRLEITLTSAQGLSYSNPVSDIEFSEKGTMLIGERTMYGDMGVCVATGTWAHQSRILEYSRNLNGLYNNGVFTIHRVGLLAPYYQNSSGGVDYEYGYIDSVSNDYSLCDSVIVGTGDYLFNSTGGLVYGVQFFEKSGLGSPNSSHYIDLNGVFGTIDKETPGDIDVYRIDSACNCNNYQDLYIQDSPADVGNEPNTLSGSVMWASNDIWVCDNSSGAACNNPGVMPVYHPSGSGLHNYVRVRVRNKSADTSCGGVLSVQWAKASTALSWPKPWDNTLLTSSGKPMGSSVGAQNIPKIPPFSSVILTFEWDPPNPNDYLADGNYTSSHFCLLARIESSSGYPYGMTFPEVTNDLYGNVKNNNNIAWRNIEIVSSYPGDYTKPINFSVGNVFGPGAAKMFVISDINSGQAFAHATVSLKLNDYLYQRWASGGKQGSLISEQIDSSINILGSGATISNIFIDSNSIQDMSLKFTRNILPDSVFLPDYNIDVVQYDQSQNKIEGGNRFDFQPLFEKILNLKLNFEANPNPVDVSVQLRNSSSPFSLVDSATAAAGGNSFSKFNFFNIVNGVGYYLVVKSINSLETWSSIPVTFTAGTVLYDFTTSMSKAYGDNQILTSGIYSIYQGDVNQDGRIDLSDVLQISNDANSFVTGVTDLNGDGITDLTDLVYASNNAANFVQVIRP